MLVRRGLAGFYSSFSLYIYAEVFDTDGASVLHGNGSAVDELQTAPQG
jgi:hypothetical protein